MKTSLLKYIYRLIIFTLIIGAVAGILFLTALKDHYLLAYPLILLMFFTVSVVFHYVLLKANEQKNSEFSRRFLMVTTGKLFIYLGFIIVYVLLDRSHAVNFLVIFLVHYFLFSIYETNYISKEVRQKSIAKGGKENSSEE